MAGAAFAPVGAAAEGEPCATAVAAAGPSPSAGEASADGPFGPAGPITEGEPCVGPAGAAVRPGLTPSMAGKPIVWPGDCWPGVPVGPCPPKVGPPGWPNPNPAAAASPGKLLRLLLSWATSEGLRLGGPIGETETVPVGAALFSPLNKP